ncbi:hypothetical protein M513_04235 [Trichuris suis]|uniref:Uncharacterized protein n=1 Tax=Trichuris suis TaxID=68888 RepID=A0A085MC55_9BILA|nr:hypothetical protein M513_04235 [Trichuris suis]
MSKVGRSNRPPTTLPKRSEPSNRPAGGRGRRTAHAVAHESSQSYHSPSESEEDISIDNNCSGWSGTQEQPTTKSPALGLEMGSASLFSHPHRLRGPVPWENIFAHRGFTFQVIRSGASVIHGVQRGDPPIGKDIRNSWASRCISIRQWNRFWLK